MHPAATTIGCFDNSLKGGVGYNSLGSIQRCGWRNATDVKHFVEDIGEAGITLANAIGRVAQGRIDWSETIYQIDKGGVGSLPIVALSASFIGMAISVQIAREIVVRYGADVVVGGFVALSMVRELAPVFVAIVITGNIGAAITAEIGTMKVTDQVDALEVFRIHPLDYLVVPRLISTCVVGPVLTLFGAYLAILTGQLFTELMVNVPAGIFWESVRYNLRVADVVNMLVKSLVFAMAIAIISCSNGLGTKGSSEAVGQSTTKTVVWCLLSIFLLNYMLTSIFFEF
jgi:phospholipid/cholesterol/gamma-HCH transport system permease protein